MDAFDHRRLKVYRTAIRFAMLAERMARALPRAHMGLADQLRRASVSIALNIAEGATETRPLEKARMYRIARRSAAECSAILDLMARVAPGALKNTPARSLLFRLGLVLDRMIEHHEAARRETQRRVFGDIRNERSTAERPLPRAKPAIRPRKRPFPPQWG